MGGWWKAPRSLGSELTTRVLTPTEFTLLVFLGVSGADRAEGFATTNEFLAGTIGVSDKTLRRALRSLRARGLITFDDHQGVAGFVVRASVTTSVMPRVSGDRSVTEVASVTGGSAEGRGPASVEGNSAAPTSVTSRARAETETENETPLSPPTGGAGGDSTFEELQEAVRPRRRRDRRTNAERLADVAARRAAARRDHDEEEEGA